MTVDVSGSDRFAASLTRPFVGLRPFNFADRKFFFGVDQQIEQLLELMEHNRMISVIGNSGSGKSSLVRAGLLPRLSEAPSEAEGWDWVVMRPGEAPIRGLTEALATPLDRQNADESMTAVRMERIETILLDSSFGIREALPHVPRARDRQLAILIDQFEEVFRFADLRAQETKDANRASQLRDEATLFIQLLLNAAADESFPGRIILTMRSDFIGDCARFHGLSEAVTKSQYLVPSLTRDQRALAIKGPVQLAGGKIAPDLVQRLLNDTSEDPDQLPVLQHAMMRCWQRASSAASRSASKKPKLVLQHYNEIGRIGKALSDHADEVLLNLKSTDSPSARFPIQQVTKRVFQSLTDMDAQNRTTRRPQKFEDLVRVLVPDDAGEDSLSAAKDAARRVILRFAELDCCFLRAIVPEQLKGDTVIDIGHEALIRGWGHLGGAGVDGRRSWVREEWDDGHRLISLLGVASHKGVIPQDRVEELERWWKEREPNTFWAARHTKDPDGLAKAADVLSRSRALIEAQEREARNKIRSKWLVRGAFATLVTIAIVMYGTITIRNAKLERLHSLQNETRMAATLGVRALQQNGADRALLFARSALLEPGRFPYVPEIEALVYRAMRDLRQTKAVPGVGTVASVLYNPDGTLTVLSDMHLVRVWDSSLDHSGPEIDVQGSKQGAAKDQYYFLSRGQDEHQLLLGGSRGAAVAEIDSSNKATIYRLQNGDEKPQFVALGPDRPKNGRFILTAGGFNPAPARLWNAEQPYHLNEEWSAQIDVPLATTAAFTDQPEYFAIGDSEGNVRLYDAMTFASRGYLPLADVGSEVTTQNPSVLGIAFNPADSEMLVAVYKDQVRLWEHISSKSPVHTELKAIEEDKKTAAAPAIEGSKKEDKKTAPAPVDFFRAAVFSADGNSIVVGRTDGTIVSWTRRSNAEGPAGYRPEILRGGGGIVSSIAFDPKEPTTFVSTAFLDTKLRVWNLRPALTREADAVGIADNAGRIPPGANPGTVLAQKGTTLNWNKETKRFSIASSTSGVEEGELKLPPNVGEIAFAAFSDDGSWLALAPDTGRILLFNLKKYLGVIATLGRNDMSWTALAFGGERPSVIAREKNGDGRLRAWRFFPSDEDLLSATEKYLPTENGKPVSMPPEDVCMLSGNVGLLPSEPQGSHPCE